MNPAHEDRGHAAFPAVLKIESLVAGGMGLGRLGGLAVFVPGTAPGDLCAVDLVKRSPDYAVGRLVRLIEPSPLRREPPCPHVPACGGCQWQHLAYEAQLDAKRNILHEAFRRIGRFPEIPMEPVVPSPDEFNYRHRVQLKVLTSGGGMRWGFYASTSHFLIDIGRCLIAHPSINSLMSGLDRFIREEGIDPSRLGIVELDVDGTGRRVECILHPRRRRLELTGHGRRVRRHGGGGEELDITVINATLIRKLPVTPGEFTFISDGSTLSAGPGVFSQNNLSLNPALVRQVLEYAAPGPGDTVADIYCGVGNYSIPLAKRSALVVAVENNRRACLYGEANAAAAGLTNVRFLQKNAAAALAELPRDVSIMVLNPPRVGAAEIMTGIARLGPRRVVYVSCSPATLARDLATLAACGYRLEALAPFDMFPQTHHLETVALMVRESCPPPESPTPGGILI